MQRFVSAFLLSRLLDYDNAVLAGLSSSILNPLRWILNAAVHLVAGLTSHDHVIDYMMELHWLPIRQRISFKLCLMMHVAVSGQCPSYIHVTITPLSNLPGRNRLHVAATSKFDVSRTVLGDNHSPWLAHASETLFHQILVTLTTERLLNEL